MVLIPATCPTTEPDRNDLLQYVNTFSTQVEHSHRNPVGLQPPQLIRFSAAFVEIRPAVDSSKLEIEIDLPQCCVAETDSELGILFQALDQTVGDNSENVYPAIHELSALALSCGLLTPYNIGLLSAPNSLFRRALCLLFKKSHRDTIFALKPQSLI